MTPLSPLPHSMPTVQKLQDQINLLQKELEKDPSKASEIWAQQQQLQIQQAAIQVDASQATTQTAPLVAPQRSRSTNLNNRPAERVPSTVQTSTSSAAGTRLSHSIPPISSFESEINAASSATGVPADLIGAVIYKESQGNPSLIAGRPTLAHRSAGVALGLMQVEPNTSPEIEAAHPEIQELDGAAYDIMLGAWRLADLARQFSGWDTVLRAYNSGAWAPVLTDPTAPITTGDPRYVYLVNSWRKVIEQGKQLPADMSPDIVEW